MTATGSWPLYRFGYQFTGSEALDEAYVPFFGAFGAAWDDAMVARWSANPLARISQCAPTARITSGGRFHPDSCRFDLVAGKRLGWVTGRAEALRQRPPWAVERSSGP